jgi:hypothetical protein
MHNVIGATSLALRLNLGVACICIYKCTTFHANMYTKGKQVEIPSKLKC